MPAETLAELWRSRYGADPPADADAALAPFLAHRSVRRFADAPIGEGLLATLVAAAQSAATSSNLQLWSAVSVDDPARRDEVARLAGDQAQIRTCARFLVFLADHHRLRAAAAAAGEAAGGLDYQEFLTMAEVDAALAAERLVCAAEAAGLGICYIGAVRNDLPAMAEFLGLPEGVFPVFGLCLGWPDPAHPADVKPRLAPSAVWFRERYDPAADVAEYDDRMRGFYEAQGMRGDATWSMRSGRRVDGRHMTGREILLGWLRDRGFARR